MLALNMQQQLCNKVYQQTRQVIINKHLLGVIRLRQAQIEELMLLYQSHKRAD